MENTRSKILDILRVQREATIEDLREALQLAPATIRRHLDILQRDGHVGVRPVRRDTGRPHYAFSMTEAGEELFPHHYVRVTNRLIDEIVLLDPVDTTGKTGSELAALIFERMADRLAESYASQISASTLEGKIREVTNLLGEEGIVFDIAPRDGGFLLVGRACPCRRVSDAHSEMCGHDQRLLARLLDADVEPVSTAGTDGGYCAYLVMGRSELARAGR